MRRTLVLLLVLAWSLAATDSAAAHARLVRSDPADGAVLSRAPSSVRLFFDDDVRLGSGMRAIENGGGPVLAGKPRLVGRRTVVLPLRADLRNGDYTVLWRVVSDDGHTIAGVLAFGVGAGRAPPHAALSAANGRSAGDVVARWLLFGGLLAAVGAAVFVRAVLLRSGVAAEAERPALARLHGLIAVGFVLVVFGVAPQIHHDPFDTRFGFALSVGAVGATIAATLAAIAIADPPLGVPAALVGVPLIAFPSFAGHALDAGRPWFEVVVDLVHITAAAVWLGGLLSLVLVLPLLRGDPALRQVGRRFSTLTLCTVGLVAATGVIRAFGELSAVSQVWSSSYGRLLIVKTGLLALLVGVGWTNRYRLVPRLGNPETVGLLRRNIGIELLLFAGLITAVALLTDTRPGRDLARAAPKPAVGTSPLPPKDAFVVAREAGSNAVAVALRPGGAAQITVLGPDGLGVDGLSVGIATLASAVQARSCGHGCYAGPVAGRPRRLTVVINGSALAFPLPDRWPPPSAGGIVRRATGAFRRASSVSYFEHLASTPRIAVNTVFLMERPNKLAYRIEGGASAIVIGDRRWDRRRRGRPWRESSQSPLRLPAPPWAGPITNAHVLHREPGVVAVTMLDRAVPAWFTLWLDARTLFPKRLQMTATAHFMKHRYIAFNRPFSIEPPR